MSHPTTLFTSLTVQGPTDQKKWPSSSTQKLTMKKKKEHVTTTTSVITPKTSLYFLDNFQRSKNRGNHSKSSKCLLFKRPIQKLIKLTYSQTDTPLTQDICVSKSFKTEEKGCGVESYMCMYRVCIRVYNMRSEIKLMSFFHKIAGEGHHHFFV